MTAPRPLTVAFLTSARMWRGSGVSFANIARGLVERGHRPHFCAGEAAVAEAFAAQGFSVSHVPTGNTGFREARHLAGTLRAIGADAIVVDRPRDLRLAALASLRHAVAIVNRYNLSRTEPPRDLLTRLAYRRVSLTLFASETNARQALERGRYLHRRPMRVITEGVDTDVFRPDSQAAQAFRSATGLDGGFVLAVGSLTADKRYDFLLEVWRRLGERAPMLAVCGEGGEAERLRQRARSLRLPVRFLGHVAPPALVGGYNAATCFVHAGAVETFGLSVLEAMACGRAVLAVRGGAVPEVLADTGVLASQDDPGEFVTRLRELIDGPALCAALGAAARSRAIARFGLPEMRRRFVAAIESVCAPGPSLGCASSS